MSTTGQRDWHLITVGLLCTGIGATAILAIVNFTAMLAFVAGAVFGFGVIFLAAGFDL